MTTDNTILVRTVQENTNPESCLRAEVEQNSRGTDITAGYKGDVRTGRSPP